MFDENPKVDTNSERSEESVNTLRIILNRRTGFLFREESPDYGVDIEVELIQENGATANTFPIQVKSSEKISTVKVDESKYISLPFKTSRLGYLHRRMPMCGLVILYDDTNKVHYYSFTDEILNRLSDRNDDSWKIQEYVSIHIPIENTLDDSSLIIVTDRIVNQCNNVRFAYETWLSNKEYDPSVNEKQVEDKIEPNLLIGYLINLDKYPQALSVLLSLPAREILGNTDLLVFAATIYSELGNVFEAQYYLRKLDRQGVSNDHPLYEVFIIVKPRIEFLLGKIDVNEYYDLLEKSLDSIKNPVNVLNTLINISQFEVVNIIKSRGTSIEKELRLLDLLNRINELEIGENKKHLFRIMISDAIATYANVLYGEQLQLYKLRSVEYTPRLEDIVDHNEAVTRYIGMKSVSQDTLQNAMTFAIENNDLLVNADCTRVIAKLYKQEMITHYVNNMVGELSNDVKVVFLQNIEGLKQAFNIYMQLEKHKEAQVTLGMILEYDKTFKVMYNEELGTTQLEDIQSNLNNLQKELGIKEYDHSGLLELEKVVNAPKPRTVSEMVASIGDDAIDFIVDRIAKAYRIPDAYKVNIRKEVIAQQKLDESGLMDYELLTRRTSHDHVKNYARSPIFQLKNIKTGLIVGPNSNIDVLISILKK